MTQVLRRPPAFTYRDYALVPEDVKRWELMEGDLFVSPSPSPRHQRISRRLQFWLMKLLEEPGLAEIFDAPIDVIFDDETVVQPDLVVLGADRAHIVTARGLEGVPNVVVEILSPTSGDRDHHLKRRIYERFGVPEYWVVDPDHGFVTAWRLEDGRYQLRARFDRSSTLSCPDFPAVNFPLLDVFR